MDIRSRLTAIEGVLDTGLGEDELAEVLELMGALGLPREIVGEMRLYSDYLPKADELGFTERQRHLHFLWDCLDRLPIGLVVDFSFPLRRMIAERLFKRCGKRFNAEQNVQFNFGHNLEVGSDVFLNRNVFLDSKGGIELGDAVGLGENVIVFTHSHSESLHRERTYAKVIIGSYAKVYSCSMILPGVTVGEQAIVAAKSMVAHDVPPNAVVAGIPAKVVRERRNEGRTGSDLDHVWLKGGAFQ